MTDHPAQSERTTLAELLRHKNLAPENIERIQSVDVRHPALMQQGDGPEEQLPPTGQPSPAGPWTDIQTLFEQGLAALKAGRLMEALKALAAVTALDAMHLKAAINLAVVLAELGLVQEAIECLEAVLKLAPGDTVAQYNLKILKQAV